MTEKKNSVSEDSAGKWHNPQDQEMREQESIRMGDVEELKRCWEEEYKGSIGRLALNPLRNIKNIAIGVITLSSRSAVSGGLNYETVMSIVDKTILDIEENYREPKAVLERLHQTQLLLTGMVRDTKDSGVYNPIISKTKDYIIRNINNKISVSDIAEWLDVNPDYLSALFRKSEKKTITSYIRERKIELSCNMLKFSDYTIQEIGARFGFCSQSHFTKCFKECMQITPKQYRNIYAVSEFIK